MNTLKGIDVSEWQGDIDWELVGTQVDFACIRASIVGSRYANNDYIDHKWEENWLQARNHTDLMLSGYYVFRPDIDVKLQIDSFLNAIHDKQTDFGWVFDVELDDRDMTKAAITERLHRCLDYFEQEKPNNEIIIYTGAWFFDKKIENDTRWSEYKLWTASYTAQPIIPQAWTDYYIWQYTNRGKLDGINGNVDLNTMQHIEQDNLIVTLTQDTDIRTGLGIDSLKADQLQADQQVNIKTAWVKIAPRQWVLLDRNFK